MVEITIEKEFKRYIPEEVPNEKILNFFRLRYPASNVLEQEVLDAYFRLNRPKGYSLRVREMEGKLEPTLKIIEKEGTEGMLERTEELRVDKISEILKIKPIEDLTEFTRSLQQKYDIEFIVKQVRTKLFIDGIEISLDTIEYFHPSGKPIPPIENAVGDSYRRLRIYEAEIKDSSFEKLTSEITNHLYEEGLVGDICTLSKKDIGEIPLS